jgi:citronellol/citronellal dehydrogenase
MSATALLRPGLLQDTTLLLAGPPAPGTPLAPTALPAAPAVALAAPATAAATPPLGAAVAQVFAELGAAVYTCLPDGENEEAIDTAVLGVLAEAQAIETLVVDGAGLFGQGALNALRVCLDSTWNVTRAVVNHAFLPAAQGIPNRRIVYLMPTPDAGEQALAARAGLENLARTLSVEWARHHINVVAIAPGLTTPADEVAALTAYLASPAGAYFSGCLLNLGIATAAG